MVGDGGISMLFGHPPTEFGVLEFTFTENIDSVYKENDIHGLF